MACALPLCPVPRRTLWNSLHINKLPSSLPALMPFPAVLIAVLIVAIYGSSSSPNPCSSTFSMLRIASVPSAESLSALPGLTYHDLPFWGSPTRATWCCPRIRAILFSNQVIQAHIHARAMGPSRRSPRAYISRCFAERSTRHPRRCVEQNLSP